MEVRVSNCASLPCLFKKGEYTTIQMDFTPSKFVVPYHNDISAKIKLQ